MMMAMVKKTKLTGTHFTGLFNLFDLTPRLGIFIFLLVANGCGGSGGEASNLSRMLLVQSGSDCTQPDCAIYLFSEVGSQSGSLQEISFGIRPVIAGISAAQGFRFQVNFLDSAQIRGSLRYATSLPGELDCYDSPGVVTCLWLSVSNLSNIDFEGVRVLTIQIPRAHEVNFERVTLQVTIDGGIEGGYDYRSERLVY